MSSMLFLASTISSIYKRRVMTEVSVFLMNKEWSTLNYREKVMVNKYDANFSYHCRLACFNPYRDLTKWQI